MHSAHQIVSSGVRVREALVRKAFACSAAESREESIAKLADRFASELTEVQRMATARIAPHRRYSRRRRRCLMRHHRPGMAGTSPVAL